MSEWPTRYDLTEEYDGYYDIMLPKINPVDMGKYVTFEDFNKLLEHCVDRLDKSDCYADLLHSQIKREILYELSKGEKND